MILSGSRAWLPAVSLNSAGRMEGGMARTRTTFQPGQSGNPAGKPKGVKHRTTKIREEILANAPGLLDSLLEQAMAGDVAAAKLLLERCLPPLRGVDEPVLVPGLEGSLSEQGQAVVSAAAQGRLTPSQAATLMTALGGQARLVELDELVKRIEKLEEKAK